MIRYQPEAVTDAIVESLTVPQIAEACVAYGGEVMYEEQMQADGTVQIHALLYDRGTRLFSIRMLTTTLAEMQQAVRILSRIGNKPTDAVLRDILGPEEYRHRFQFVSSYCRHAGEESPMDSTRREQEMARQLSTMGAVSATEARRMMGLDIAQERQDRRRSQAMYTPYHAPVPQEAFVPSADSAIVITKGREITRRRDDPAT